MTTSLEQLQTNNQTTMVTDTMSVETRRAVEEIQAAMIIAQKFPRDVTQSVDRIRAACDQIQVAESALYSYKRGDKLVEGPSIRLMEMMAQCWGNIDSHTKEVRQGDDHGERYSEVETMAWDMETNTRSRKTFRVPHKRYTRDGSYALTDPRDIYETVANNGSRRLRACLEAVIPSYVRQMAVDKCKETLRNKVHITQETIKGLLHTFADVDVSQDMIAQFLGHPITLQDLTRSEYMNLRGIYAAIRDNQQKVDDFFKKPTVNVDSLTTEPSSTMAAASRNTPETRVDVEPPFSME